MKRKELTKAFMMIWFKMKKTFDLHDLYQIIPHCGA